MNITPSCTTTPNHIISTCGTISSNISIFQNKTSTFQTEKSKELKWQSSVKITKKKSSLLVELIFRFLALEGLDISDSMNHHLPSTVAPGSFISTGSPEETLQKPSRELIMYPRRPLPWVSTQLSRLKKSSLWHGPKAKPILSKGQSKAKSPMTSLQLSYIIIQMLLFISINLQAKS